LRGPPIWTKTLDIQSQFANCRGNLGYRICDRSEPWGVPKPDQRIVALEERLQRLKQRHRRSEARRRTRESRRSRQDEARKRDLVGAVILATVAQGKLEELVLRGWLEEELTEAEDRKLFELPAR
jgi:hypothetical protein